jgi:hypothetical protein
VNGARGSAYDESCLDSLASHMARFSLSAIKDFPVESGLQRTNP